MNSKEITIKESIDKIYSLPKAEAELLINSFTKVDLPAKSVIFKNGQISDKLYFISKGCLRSYYNLKDQEVTLWLGHEGDFISCFRSWMTRLPGHESIQLVEDCVLYSITYSEMEKLTKENAEINHFYRRLIEDGYLYWEKRSTMLLFNSAKTRYDDLVARYPLVMQRWPLGQIASYLGITQETLSRLRSEK